MPTSLTPRTRLTWLLQRVTSLLILFLVIACSPPTEPELRIGATAWVGNESFFLADRLGYYNETAISLVEMPSSAENLRAIRNGLLEGASMTLDESLSLAAEGVKIKIVLVMDFSNGGDALIAKPGITSMEDLRGKLVAVEQASTGAILLDGALQSAGMQSTDIHILPCKMNDSARCYEMADAVVTFSPATTRLMQMGGNMIFNSSQIPNRIADVLVVRADIVERSPNTLRRLIAGYFNALDKFRQNPEGFSTHMVQRTEFTAADALSAVEGVRFLDIAENMSLLTGENAGLRLIANELVDLMRARSLLDNGVSTDNLIDEGFLPEVEP